MLSRTVLALSSALSIVVAAAPARAQGIDGGNIDINAFRPAMDSRGYITVNASQVLGHNELSFGLVTSWGRNVITLEDGDDMCIQAPGSAEPCSYKVTNFISPTLVGAYGLKLGLIELEFGAAIPFNVMSGDRAPDFVDGNNANNSENFQFDGQGVGDISLHLKTRFLNTSRGPKIGLAVIGSLYLPTATEKDKWLGEDAVVPQVMGVLDKEFGDQGRLRLAVTGGIRLRVGGEVEFVDNMADDEVDRPVTNERVAAPATTVPIGAAIAYALSPQKFDLVAEAYSNIPLGGENYFPLEAIVGIKVYLAKNSFLSLGAGAGGLLPGQGANPDLRAFLGIVFEPNIGDRDGDGIKDDVDACPDDAEDYDQFEDSDGCPELDNDRDGIVDLQDQCPNEPEDKDGNDDEDGCPEANEMDRDGDGILDDQDECPDDPEDMDGFEDSDGCPDVDNDQDGILDVDDLCPNDPEDMDGFEDEDGCPDPDNDRDRILDVDDQCPNEPETYNGVDDSDGCPDRGRVVVTDTKIEILDKVYFEYNRAKIKAESFPILDAVAATMEGNPDILRVEIQGHTDERGSDSYNLQLSDDRANSVMQYLIDKGLSPERLQAQGYGETQPVDPRSNEEAWAKNRRVEFLILRRGTE